ncbi:hypothetical protein SAMD00019534_115710 [Acytostelium subglobosum LB1]|uniref:hypothetical protein n=1 Tax=Acytostelium subglobosum LB1 TaxID=1410327 RepID=UPI0006450DB0|nr:hypothetical protein SAMD00019534_115710 [Acytostelium subglobosum LB1]GAM28395.1 hypothetical protein SAMD00019534_115710 [Acytostelium subglobosum LB1]|eukprot:XP_012748712.1 hypothetical protein SAMD00019534_115710 [Acytostelium subglobosum LB1]
MAYQSDLFIKQMDFVNNTAASLITCKRANFLMTGSTISNNNFQDLLIDINNVEQSVISNCTINNNINIRLGGTTTLIENGGSLLIKDTDFDGNSNLSYLLRNNGNMTIVRTSLTNNSIKNGQLVYGFFSIVSMTNCTLSNNMFVGSNIMRMTGSRLSLHDVVIGVNLGLAISAPIVDCSKGHLAINNIKNHEGRDLVSCDEEYQCSLQGDHPDICRAGLSGGAIAGVVIGCIVGTALIVAVMSVVIRRRRRRSSSSSGHYKI